MDKVQAVDYGPSSWQDAVVVSIRGTMRARVTYDALVTVGSLMASHIVFMNISRPESMIHP